MVFDTNAIVPRKALVFQSLTKEWPRLAAKVKAAAAALQRTAALKEKAST